MYLIRKAPLSRSRLMAPGMSMLLALAGLALMGCSKDQDAQTDIPQAVVLAKVNGEAITEEDLAFSLERTFNQMDMLNFTDELRQKVLDSLIASRAMKQLAIKELSADQIEKIENLTRAYQEELYVKEYLQAHVSPTPVTPEMVKKYYDEHPEEFGSTDIRDYEVLIAPANISDAMRDDLLQKVSAIRQVSDWSASAGKWGEQWGLQHQKGRSQKGLLNKILDQQINSLAKNDTSNAFYIDGQLHLVRVTNLVKTPPKSLAEVSGDIRQRLAPLMLREAVKQASDDARDKVQVEVISQAE
jgi:hypothetical protein